MSEEEKFDTLSSLNNGIKMNAEHYTNEVEIAEGTIKDQNKVKKVEIVTN